MSKFTKKGKELIQENDARKSYNETINQLPQHLKDLTPVGNKIYVRLFKFEETVKKDASGVIDPKFVEKYSDSGKVGAKLDKIEYKPVALVVAVPDAAKEYITESLKTEINPGDVVWIDPTQVNHSSQVFLDRETPKTTFEGFLKVHPSAIEFIEATKLPLTYEGDA